MHVQMYNISGKLLVDKKVNVNNLEKINLSGYPKGMYVLILNTKTGHYLEKLVLE